VAQHGGSRRLNRTEPGRSLLLLKSTSAVPHGGGARFGDRSDEYRLLARWIAEGAGFDAADAPRLTRLEVLPRERVLVQPAGMQRLSVLAHFSDGAVRSVADLAGYSSGDPTVSVTPDGTVTAYQADAAILVRYAEQMQTVRLTFVPARKEFAWRPVPAANWIDELNYPRLKTLRLEPSPLSSDSEFLRRAFIDALGMLPPTDEAREFLADTRPDKRARLIDSLLERPQFDDYWTMRWADVLRVEERSLDPKGAAAYRDWIRAGVASNKPLDEFVRELLLGSGSTYASPPANYYRRTRNAAELAENTAQVFMGTRMLCAKCHNHPTERWKQDDYYGLAAVFARVGRKGELTRKDIFDKNELVGEETISVARTGEVSHPRTGQPVLPRVPFASAPLPAGEWDDPRAPFARWLTGPENPLFARAMVNRIWYYVVGKGIVDPVDDLRDSNPPSNPELFDALAQELVRSGYDLRHMVRLILNSRTYQLSSQPSRTNADDERFFSRAIVQRLPAEVLLDAISDVTGVPERFNSFPSGTRAIHLYTLNKRPNAFLKLFGQPQRESVCECERSGETALGQSFALISGETLNGKLRAPENRIGTLIAAGKSDAEILSELYLAVYTREPAKKELDAALGYIHSKPDRRTALEDLMWALLNSKEFLLRR